ncbi:hypothetical protein [Aeromicrobium sp.]|uniref:hypothetical protein n=1 Tax=Aeromicrobium sp. TaxID=1871063 RepID=UPI003C33ED38
MHEPPPSRPYPPDTIWRFPPPPVSRLWLVAAIVGGVIGLTVLGGAFTYLGLNANRDIPGFIDDQNVLDVASRECELMTSTVEGLPMNGSADERREALADQNTAVMNMVERIREISSKVRASDQPLDAWLADWESLVSGRRTYIDQQRKGNSNKNFRVPRTSDGDPINERMDFAAQDICTVPDVLLRPDLAGTRGI